MMENPVGRWSAPATSIQVEYSTAVMGEIRAYAVEGCQRILRGGLDVGGVLFGSREKKLITVQAFRFLAIEYALGPTFSLSAKDRPKFADAARAHEHDPGLKGLMPVGWFVSHPRLAGVSMTAHDESIFKEFFPERWQVTLVLRPARLGLAGAGFFIHEPDGTVRRERSYHEFEVAPLMHRVAAPAPEPQRAMAAAAGSTVVASVGATAPDIAQQPRPMTPPWAPVRQRKRRRFWLWATVPMLLVAAAAAVAFWMLWKAPPPRLDLSAIQQGEHMLVRWNPASVASAESATIETVGLNGSGSRLFRLKGEQLSAGAFSIDYGGGDLSLRMAAFGKGGGPLSKETAHFLGRPPGPPAELATAREEAQRLRDDKAKLEATLKLQAARTKKLDERVKVMEKIIRNESALKGSAGPSR